MSKHQNVTVDDRKYIATLVESHNTTNMKDFLEGIKEAKKWLKDSVEEKGLFFFVSSILDNIPPLDGMPYTFAEQLVAKPISLELNERGFMELVGEFSDIGPSLGEGLPT